MRRITLATLVAVSIAVPFSSLPAYAGPLSGRIVYTDAFGGTGLYTISPDGTERKHLVDVGGDGVFVYHPKWFPDGSAVSFVAETSARSTRLDAVDPDGSNRRVLLGRAKLPVGWKQILTYDWSPDGTQLVLCLFSKGSDRQRLYDSTPDGSSMDRIAGNACSPDWSSQDRIAAIRGTRLIELDPDGGNLVRIATGMQSADPAWSPNGEKIAFMCGGFSHADICISNADGTRLKNLTNSDRTDWSPDWSPDGSRIVWAPATKNTKYQYGDLWRMRSDGSAKTRLTNTPGRDEYEPDWTAVG